MSVMKPYRVMDYCCGSKNFNFAVDPTENGLVAAMLGF